MPEYVIRKIELNELDVCADVIRQSFATSAKEFGLTIQNCPSNGAFIQTERLIADWSKGNKMYGLYHDNRFIGFIELEKKSANQYELEKLAVLPDYRHLGYGACLLEFARKMVEELGGTKITVGIIEKNTILKDWYLRYGFVHTGTKFFSHLPFLVGFMELVLR